MRIIICDDDIEITIQLEQYLQRFFALCKLKVPEIFIFHSGDELLSDVNEKDIVFLDVEMPGISGIHVGKQLKNQNKNVIIFIVTSFTEYLDDAMRFHVFRYLSKPIDKERLYRNFKDALKLYNTNSANVCVETKTEIYTIPLNSIVMIEAQGHKTIVRTTNNDYHSTQTMEHWLNTLPSSSFFQTHRSYLINLEYVEKFDHSLIHLYNLQFQAYLTKRKYTLFKNQYALFLESMG